MKTFRVATLNIWNRFGPWDERLPAIRAGVRELAPDVLGLQEVVRLAPGEGDELDQAAAIADGFGYHVAYGRAHDESCPASGPTNDGRCSSPRLTRPSGVCRSS
jgi:endonuclease/exonuclease/phosphatase family metal-dependent hydrolase